MDDSALLTHYWQQYRASEDTQAKNALIDAYLPLVETLAAIAYGKRVSGALSYQDMLHYGMVGLLDAIDRFLPDQGADFKTYASYRIRGEIYDGINRATEVASQICAHKARLRQRAQSLKSDPKQEQDVLGKLIEQAIGLAIGFMLDEGTLYQSDTPQTALQDTVYQSCELKDLARQMARLVKELPKNQKRVIELHYFHQFSFTDIAVMLALSKGRVAQLHKEGLSALRALYDTG